jgi:hypothetical protein
MLDLENVEILHVPPEKLLADEFVFEFNWCQVGYCFLRPSRSVSLASKRAADNPADAEESLTPPHHSTFSL